MKTFLINNKRYIAKELTFGAIRQLESNGITLSELGSRPFSLASGYLAFCAGISINAADEEIEKHVINGGNLDGIFEAVTEAMNESRFFQALNKKTETEQEVQDIPVVPIQEIPGQAVPIQIATPVGEAVIQ